MSSNQHPGDKSTQYPAWDSRRLFDRLLEHACRRLDILRETEEQRHIALPATAEQMRFLLQLARELKAEESAVRQPSASAVCNSPTEALTEEKAAPAQEAFNKLDAIDRAAVRDASSTLFSLNDVLAEALIEYKQSVRKTNEDGEGAPEDEGENTNK
jgi:hypothetical protein